MPYCAGEAERKRSLKNEIFDLGQYGDATKAEGNAAVAYWSDRGIEQPVRQNIRIRAHLNGLRQGGGRQRET